ncbi:MAG TPA: hypothetical protein VNY05_34395 [Candidatus Acidoferrales bacterium]|jgi:hypothetical protein|nr:hypothetical protein [Candidatus Acidoferrales bacterium]
MKAAVFATSQYEREGKRLLTKLEIDAMEASIAADPEAHPVVPGTGGVRKARWSRQGKGKRGGVRVVYYYWVLDNEVYMLLCTRRTSKRTWMRLAAKLRRDPWRI